MTAPASRRGVPLALFCQGAHQKRAIDFDATWNGICVRSSIKGSVRTIKSRIWTSPHIHARWIPQDKCTDSHWLRPRTLLRSCRDETRNRRCWCDNLCRCSQADTRNGSHLPSRCKWRHVDTDRHSRWCSGRIFCPSNPPCTCSGNRPQDWCRRLRWCRGWSGIHRHLEQRGTRLRVIKPRSL